MNLYFRFLNLLFLIVVCEFSYSQNSLPWEIQNLSAAKQFISQHILELEAIEGVYDVENTVHASTGRRSRTTRQHFIWVILDISRFNNSSTHEYVAYSVSGDERGYMGNVSILQQGSYYVFETTNGNGQKNKDRFMLENGLSFRITNETFYSGVGSVSRSTNGIKTYPTVQMYQEAVFAEKQKNNTSSGTGFFLSNNGYIVTNNHVIENAQNGNIKITGINEDYHKSYQARVEVTDKQNDLAILKITDPLPVIKVPYVFKFTTSSVGEDCFVLGYPLISSMGKDIKLTTGIISSKTGFDSNIAQYQISAPVQPGNSGGPLFDKNGNIIGVVQAKHTQAENAGYAIKASYIRNLVELLPTSIAFPQTNLLKGKSLPQQVEQASKSVCLIIVNGND